MSKRPSEDADADSTTKKQAKSKTILERLDDGEVIIGDGGYITEMERRGYATAGPWTPEVNVEHPQAVEELHKEFLRAGSDVLQAFTFFASEDMMKKIGHQGDDINEAACKTVKKISEETGCLWAGCLSMTNLYTKGGSKTEVQEVFRKQAKIFMEYGADLLIAEFFWSCEEIEWALEILKETGKPVAASMCISSTGDSKGVPTEECGVRMVKAGADIVGINCNFDPNESLKAVAKMKEGVEKAGLKAHLMVQPLGFHCPDGGKRGYMSLPEWPYALEPRALTRWDVHKLARSAYDLGVRYIGGCCGFKAYHIRAIAEELAPERGRSPESSKKHNPFGGELFVGDESDKKPKEYWLNLKPSSGRPLSSALSEPIDN